MKCTKIQFFFLILLSISCSNRKPVDEPLIPELTGNTQKISEPLERTAMELVSFEFNPRYILLSDTCFEKPDVKSERVYGLYSGDLINVLRYGDYVSLNGENKQWIQIWDNHSIGWVFVDDIKELKQPVEYNPMNKTDSTFLILSNINGNNRFKIEEKNGGYSCEYGMNKIRVSFYKRDEIFDDDFQHDCFYFPEDYRKMELCIDNDVDVFPSIYFDRNQRKNTNKFITFVDTFMFSAHESQDQEIRRVIRFTTNNYDIEIIIWIPGNSGSSDVIRKIMEEAPQYFLLYKNNERPAPPFRETLSVWNSTTLFFCVIRTGGEPCQCAFLPFLRLTIFRARQYILLLPMGAAVLEEALTT